MSKKSKKKKQAAAILEAASLQAAKQCLSESSKKVSPPNRAATTANNNKHTTPLQSCCCLPADKQLAYYRALCDIHQARITHQREHITGLEGRRKWLRDRQIANEEAITNFQKRCGELEKELQSYRSQTEPTLNANNQGSSNNKFIIAELNELRHRFNLTEDLMEVGTTVVQERNETVSKLQEDNKLLVQQLERGEEGKPRNVSLNTTLMPPSLVYPADSAVPFYDGNSVWPGLTAMIMINSLQVEISKRDLMLEHLHATIQDLIGKLGEAQEKQGLIARDRCR